MKTTTDLLATIPAFAHQNLRVEFASLPHHSPPGLYLTPDPKNPSHFPGLLLPRHGPYAGAIFKFSLRIPASYPRSAPVITFTTEVWHPLVVPFTSPAFPGEVSLKGMEGGWGAEGREVRDGGRGPAGAGVSGGKSGRDLVSVLRYLVSVMTEEEAIRGVPSWAVANSLAMRQWRGGEWEEGVRRCVERSKEAARAEGQGSMGGATGRGDLIRVGNVLGDEEVRKVLEGLREVYGVGKGKREETEVVEEGEAVESE
ncbi:UBC-like protein [Ascobolus immersus RN42]|uniref:UBC-like protein n=1 Tax=Ascobolus immersus RN42 TaxID=1160509 RepID=A0A3N4HTW2_ASCIM|nr:UBC-like protein [Ascobolus immersus RN42]